MAYANKKNDNGFYEQYRESNDKTHIIRNTPVLFPPHFHMNVEIFIVKNGAFEVTLNGEKYSVSDGSVLFCSSYDVHSYDKSLRDSGALPDDYAVVLIPPLLLKDFYAENAEARPKVPVVKSKKLCKSLLEMVDRVLSREDLSPAVTRASVNLFLALIENEFDFTAEKTSRSTGAIRDMLEYILNNYRDKISLEKIARNLGYSPEHLSRVFHSYFNKSVSDYINEMRLNYVENALKTQKKSKKISELAFEAGFQSLQSYYRVKNKYLK